ncbi:MAG: hypothetical protein ABI268_02990, partial [Rhodanobacter sp.]
MTDTLPAVALLFDDRELGGHLRAALQERGARIVHEGGVSGFSRELLNRVGADVVVVNLEDNADDALDRLYEVIDGDQPRVVFNDADASRTLAGWDRARWARHLAVKVLAIGDLDPPRPEDALAVDEPFASQDVSILDEPVVVETQSPPATSTDLTATMDDSMASSDVTSTESVVSLVADFQPNPDVDADPVWASQLQPELLQQSEHEPELGLQLQSALEPELESKSELKPEPDANLEPESLPGTEPEWLAAPVCGDEQEN